MKRGYLPELGAAIRADQVETVKQLLLLNPDCLHLETPFGSWLDMAAREGKLEIAKLLLHEGLDPNRVNHHGETALCRAAYGGHTAIVQLLFDCGGDIGEAATEVANPMFGAVLSRSVDVARVLLEKGLDASIDYGNGKTVASFAVLNGAEEIADIIAEHLAAGDAAKKATILQEARRSAQRQPKPQQVRILPVAESSSEGA
jgi:ankyrin repeat protein